MTRKPIDEREFTENFYKHSYIELCEIYGICQKKINDLRKQFGLSKKKGRKPINIIFKEEE